MGKGDSWSDPTESGLLDDFDFTVEEAWFGENEESDNNDGRIFLFLRGTAIDDEGEEHEDHVERYSTGKNWEVVDDGAAVENAAGRQKFNQNAGIGRLINAFVALGEDVLAYLGSRGDTFQAKTYEGLQMHMNGRVVSTWENDDGETVEWRLNLPTSVKVKKAAKKGGKGKASRSASTKSKPKKKGNASLRAAISEFAAQFDEDEHDEFVTQVLDEDVFDQAEAILDDDELHAEVLDPDSDLWTEAER